MGIVRRDSEVNEQDWQSKWIIVDVFAAEGFPAFGGDPAYKI